MQYIYNGFLICFMFAILFLPACFSSAVEDIPSEGFIKHIDDVIIREVLQGYTPVPKLPAGVASIKIPKLTEIIVFVESFLSKTDVSFEIYLDVDGKRIKTTNRVISSGSKIPIEFNLPFEMKGEHEIKAVGFFEKPPGLLPWKEGLDFGRRETLKIFDVGGLRKFHFVDFAIDIDGDLSKWEDIPPISFGAEGGISAEIYPAWDDQNVYIAVLVNDEEHFNSNSGDLIWDGDALQFSFVLMSSESFEPFNLGLALASGIIETYQWMGPETGLLERSEYAVSRDDESKTTLYEMKIPFECLKIPGKPGAVFGFNAVVFDDTDGAGYAYWIEITPGIAGGWRPDKFSKFILWDL